MAQINRSQRVSTREGQRRVAVQRRMRACRVVVKLKLGKLRFQITGIPEQYMVEKPTPHRPDHYSPMAGRIGWGTPMTISNFIRGWQLAQEE